MEKITGKVIVSDGASSSTITSRNFVIRALAIAVVAFVTSHSWASTVTTSSPNEMKVIAVKDQPMVAGPSENFIGKVHVQMLMKGEAPSNLGCGYVQFEAGARSNWHTHPKGQLLIITEGEGLVQEWDKPLRRIKVGDVVWTPPGVKHWHGSAPGTPLTHAAVTESFDGKTVTWLEHVTDAQYKTIPK